MDKCVVVFFLAMLIPGGCKSPAEKQVNSPLGEGALAHYREPPSFDAGMGVEQAYAAIPHRRTVWTEEGSAVPAEEKTYLKGMFQALDQAVAVRVSALQDFSNGRFERVDVDAEFDLLISYVQGMAVPGKLATYHKEILAGLSGEKQFFNEWRAQRDRFPFAQQIANHPGVRSSSAALRAAYAELMANYPGEGASNKEAFFDYHCALDFL
jgi:hypothetical protein